MSNLVVNSDVVLWMFDVIVVVVGVLAIKALREPQCQQVWALIEQGTYTWQETAVDSFFNVVYTLQQAKIWPMRHKLPTK